MGRATFLWLNEDGASDFRWVQRRLTPINVSVSGKAAIAGAAFVLLSMPSVIGSPESVYGQQVVKKSQLILQIGEELGPDEYTFNLIADVDVSPRDGGIYVLDGGDQTVKRYDRLGNYVSQFGRAGQGPGEFGLPHALSVDSTVRVYDIGQRRMSVFSLDGEHIRTRRLGLIGPANLSMVFPIRNGMLVGVTTPRFAYGHQSDDPNFAVLALYPTADAIVDTLLVCHSGGTVWHARGKPGPWGIADSPFGFGGAWAVHADSLVAVVNGYTGEGKVYLADSTGLTIMRQFQLPYESRPVSERDVAGVEENFRARREGLGHPVGAIMLEPPPRWSIARRALFAHNGDLWINIGSIAEIDAEQFLVIEQEGDQMSEFTLPAGFQLSAVREDLLYGTAQSELGAGLVRVYKMSSSP
ncbi:MAG: 6-bladed beta-propeller [Gemmatimonadetes bacterium]|uniref:6-bladed beta-propeller n=1 Tax=Candidatus Kutchimonas denitrificans TaxID=3056748 RepID=A0AAE4Z6N0_9BACT|nr:6-bladed beta-propeller [Gemmatimonadota bacterium]NIR74329.1 6-bladed beta-propeller [Candidatus Kutchimonas denitrificans]NIS01385.1 6-bladed beta-propeller [Gemmatimonadota bacterium]NIT67125.1 6-bladed beta-propeller [Gemmatimonadota bacterium]NIU52781.1 6-bladed beta-propeller [Gemmatimonadota bacterium]